MSLQPQQGEHLSVKASWETTRPAVCAVGRCGWLSHRIQDVGGANRYLCDGGECTGGRLSTWSPVAKEGTRFREAAWASPRPWAVVRPLVEPQCVVLHEKRSSGDGGTIDGGWIWREQ